MAKKLTLPDGLFDKFVDAVGNSEPVSGLTHNFYRYPARSSPEFARPAILAFSKPGDLLLDPFMGGGTTLVEAMATGRHAIGVGHSPLATFVADVKTTAIGEKSLEKVLSWAEDVVRKTRSKKKSMPSVWAEGGYQKDIPAHEIELGWLFRNWCITVPQRLGFIN